MKLIPLNDKVLILPTAADTTTPGGIIIPGTAEGKPTRGKVIALGLKVQEKLGVPSGDPFLSQAEDNVKVGCSVMFPAYSGVEVDIDGVKHRLLPAEEILGVILES